MECGLALIFFVTKKVSCAHAYWVEVTEEKKMAKRSAIASTSAHKRKRVCLVGYGGTEYSSENRHLMHSYDS